MPIFLALFRMLDQASKKGEAHGFLTQELAKQFGDSKLFGAIPVSGTFLSHGGVTRRDGPRGDPGRRDDRDHVH